MKHKHRWVFYRGPAIGYWEKRECPGDGVYFKGHAEICILKINGAEECMATRFVCDDKRYRIVEAELFKP